MNNGIPVLYLVIPCYNEEEILPLTAECVRDKLYILIEKGSISSDSKVVFVNDGSRDGTWTLITELHKADPIFTGIDLSRNRGHQNALLAGLMYAKEYCDITVSMDADLQDDINVIDDMLIKYGKGADIVYGVRSSRAKDSFFKRATAEGFYKFMNIMGVEILFNHADCRLMNRRTLDALSEYKEINVFLRGIVPQLGYKTDISYYERNERCMGESKYPLRKMLSFAVDGITSFSVKPLRFITFLGTVIFLICTVSLIVSFICEGSYGIMMSAIGILSGLQILCLGVIGEYIGKIYGETKHRPRYIIREILK